MFDDTEWPAQRALLPVGHNKSGTFLIIRYTLSVVYLLYVKFYVFAYSCGLIVFI